MGISGKCDFEDVVDIHSPEEILSKYKIYADKNSLVPLKIETIKELVVYYPYLVPMMSSSKEDGGKIHLSSKSYIDQEEEERLQSKLDELKRYYRKCKRKKTNFDANEAFKLIGIFADVPQKYEVELVNRVAELGNEATFEGVHTPAHERMRDKWYQLMIDNGWAEDQAYGWVYGWKRWFDRIGIKSDDYNKDGSYQQQTLGEF